MSIPINDLTPTQAGLRNRQRAIDIGEKIEAGTKLERRSPIAITRFEDNRLFVHDGHHYIVGLIFGGRDTLENDEFKVTDWTYEQYREVNWNDGFITPFNPNTEMKVADLARFRTAVQFIRERNGDEAAEDFIRTHGYLYLVPRRLKEFWELAALTFAGLTCEASDHRLHDSDLRPGSA